MNNNKKNTMKETYINIVGRNNNNVIQDGVIRVRREAQAFTKMKRSKRKEKNSTFSQAYLLDLTLQRCISLGQFYRFLERGNQKNGICYYLKHDVLSVFTVTPLKRKIHIIP